MTDMSAPTLVPASGGTNDLELAIREFIAGEAAKMKPPTAERYGAVAEALFEFLDTVDVRIRLGPEIALYLELERRRVGAGAFRAAV